MAAAAADKKFMAKYTDDEVAGTALTKISKDFRRQLKKHLLSKNFDVETMTLEDLEEEAIALDSLDYDSSGEDDDNGGGGGKNDRKPKAKNDKKPRSRSMRSAAPCHTDQCHQRPRPALSLIHI